MDVALPRPPHTDPGSVEAAERIRFSENRIFVEIVHDIQKKFARRQTQAARRSAFAREHGNLVGDAERKHGQGIAGERQQLGHVAELAWTISESTERLARSGLEDREPHLPMTTIRDEHSAIGSFYDRLRPCEPVKKPSVLSRELRPLDCRLCCVRRGTCSHSNAHGDEHMMCYALMTSVSNMVRI
jgi:hypothetical protein